MRLDDFQQLVQRLLKEVPPSYLDGIVAVEVSPKTVPHPVHAEIYTLGECIPMDWSGSGTDLQSRVVLYHGSFQALARLSEGEFDWREEAWKTLTHELRHHLEWRASVGALEAFDWAAEQNFARHEGQRFDPAFYRSGERVAQGVYKVDDDVFIEGERGSAKRAADCRTTWHGRRYRVPVPAGAKPPLFLVLDGLDEPPPGDAVLVFPRRVSLLDFWRRPPPKVQEAVVTVEPLDA